MLNVLIISKGWLLLTNTASQRPDEKLFVYSAECQVKGSIS